jgi:CBS domain-containing protein
MFGRKKSIRVGRLMSYDPRTCGPDDSSSQAAQIMWDNDCGCVPVVDAEGRAIGMITDRDICMAAFTRGKPLSEIPVSTVFSRNVVTVHEDEPVEAAEAAMRSHRVRRVPVVDARGRPVGILSLNDLARRAGHHRGDVDVNDFVGTFAAICEPAARATAAE